MTCYQFQPLTESKEEESRIESTALVGLNNDYYGWLLIPMLVGEKPLGVVWREKKVEWVFGKRESINYSGWSVIENTWSVYCFSVMYYCTYLLASKLNYKIRRWKVHGLLDSTQHTRQQHEKRWDCNGDCVTVCVDWLVCENNSNYSRVGRWMDGWMDGWID